ncbi:MAG: twin-arginine translocase subunit TatC [Bdellovibrionales bacterium CG10_big_fil_rev_8_21_14_0_10_45_34]|nr:MAG: twin-arginine translocase subunit TatC [Bdellovibrionales bacterium CG10_big_fil_rev_8_21_14_0_10_45_34]
MAEVDNEFEAQPLVEHLSELRKRLFWSLLAILIGCIACWNFSEKIFDIVRHPIEPFLTTATQGGLVFTGVMDKFVAHIKVSLFAGVVISAPFWMYQVWLFVSPALYRKEKKYAFSFLTVGSLLFAVGILFAYKIFFPTAFEFLLGFGGEKDTPFISISEYLSFFMLMSLAMGVSFELPLVLVVLGVTGVIDRDFLARNRRYAILLLALLSGIVTPPDPLSLVMMLVPMVILYESAVWIVKLLAPKNPTIE